MTTTGACLCLLALLAFCQAAFGEGETPRPGTPLSEAEALKLARVALAGIGREYPNKPGAVLTGPEDVVSPRTMHPAFYGCFDWHSAVHGHWMLVRLLRLQPKNEALRGEALPLLEKNLRADHLQTEAAYFTPKENQGFERTYGWAWLLRLAQELRAYDDDAARTWARNLRPLEARIVELTKAYLPKLARPIRSGEHRDTAFALAFFHDYARAVKDSALRALVEERARTWYGDDEDYPERYEPSGHDFFSAGLNVADLMGRVLEPEAFAAWLTRFAPGLGTRTLKSWATPTQVDDVTDGKLVHLAGLNLTRAWTMRGIAHALPETDERRTYLLALSKAHTDAGFAYVFTGHYAGEHWLASFATYLVTMP